MIILFVELHQNNNPDLGVFVRNLELRVNYVAFLPSTNFLQVDYLPSRLQCCLGVVGDELLLPDKEDFLSSYSMKLRKKPSIRFSGRTG